MGKIGACDNCNINIDFALRFDLRSHMQQQHGEQKQEKKPLEQPPVVKKEKDGVKKEKGLKKEKEVKREKEGAKKEEGMKKSKQLKVEGELPAMVKKEKKIPVMKKVKKEVAPDLKKMDLEVPMEEDTNSKNDLLTAKEEVAPTVIKKKEKVTKGKKVKKEEEVAMEQDTSAKFDEAMMEEYDDNPYVEDEFLEEMVEKKADQSPPLNNQPIESTTTNKPIKKQPKNTNAEKPKHNADVQQPKKQLWGTEADGGWYASSAKIVDRFFFKNNSNFCSCSQNASFRFKLKDLELNLGKEAFPNQVTISSISLLDLKSGGLDELYLPLLESPQPSSKGAN